MKITKMTQSKKVQDRYYLDLEDGSSIKVNVALIADYSLYTGRELSDEELISLKEAALSNEIKARALRMTGARAMSRKEVTDRLTQKGADADSAEETADWLENLGIVNDEEYAGMIARHYSAKGYGIGKVKNELYRRGVPKEYWESALEEISGTDESVDKIISLKLKNGENDPKTIKKLTAMLLRRGFTWEEVRHGLERYRVSLEDMEYDV